MTPETFRALITPKGGLVQHLHQTAHKMGTGDARVRYFELGNCALPKRSIPTGPIVSRRGSY